MKSITKKTISLFLALGLVLALVGCGNKTGDKDNKEKRKLVISTWGLGEENLMKDVFKPFEEKYNAEIVLEMATTTERLTKLKENPNSEVDVIELSQGAADEAQLAGLVDKLDVNKFSNAKDLIEPAKKIAERGFGLPYVVNSIGIVYNPNGKLKEIKEWSDLWDKNLESRIAIPDITTTFGPATLAVAGDVAGTSIDKDMGKAAFAKLEELKPNVVKAYAKSSDLAIMFANGEIDAAIVGDFAYGIVKKALPDVVYIVPQSGTYVNFNTIEVNKNSKNKDLAMDYINFRLDKEVQERTAKSLNEAPTNGLVVLDDETKGNKTYGDIIDRSKVLDYTFINENLSLWVEQFNSIMNK